MKKCSLCNSRRGRRACPALGYSICPTCCGSKRLVEINCPSDCGYLRSSQSHPPALVQRQREQDLGFLIPLLEGMTERQQQLTLSIQSFLRTERPDTPTMFDDDVVQATRAIAETYETASRGIIYEHNAGLASAELLASELRTLVKDQRDKGLRLTDAETAVVMRRIEIGAREAKSVCPGEKKAYLELLKRVLKATLETPNLQQSSDGQSSGDTTRPGESSLIIPGR